jgi:hypothetical protein
LQYPGFNPIEFDGIKQPARLNRKLTIPAVKPNGLPSSTEKALIESRIAAHEHDPSTAIPWEKFEERLKPRPGK